MKDEREISVSKEMWAEMENIARKNKRTYKDCDSHLEVLDLYKKNADNAISLTEPIKSNVPDHLKLHVKDFSKEEHIQSKKEVEERSKLSNKIREKSISPNGRRQANTFIPKYVLIERDRNGNKVSSLDGICDEDIKEAVNIKTTLNCEKIQRIQKERKEQQELFDSVDTPNDIYSLLLAKKTKEDDKSDIYNIVKSFKEVLETFMEVMDSKNKE